MKYRTKLYLAFSGLILGTVFLNEALTYEETKKRLFSELHSKVLGAAATAATLLHPDEIDTIIQENSDQSDSYQKVVKKLRKVRDANRRTDFLIEYVYIIRPDPKNSSQFLVVADATEDPAIYVGPGTPYPEGTKFGIIEHLGTPYSPDKMIVDRWGKFLTGYAPIFDQNGRYIATVGVNISAEYVAIELNHLRLIDLWTMLIALSAGLITATIFAHTISDSLGKIYKGVTEIGHGNLATRINIHSNDEFDSLSLAINEMAKGLQERERLKLNFTRYVSKHVLEKILASDKVPSLEGERRKITVLFSDIRHFTQLAERLPPENVLNLLNEYLAIMLDVIFSNSGTLDKFMGDGIMVEFGAPLDDPQQEFHAIKTAIEMQKALKVLNQKWKKQNRPEITMGIGVHTGFAVIGNVGSEERMDYTAIGDTVNVASRLEQATKEIQVPILISAETWTQVKDYFKGKSVGPMHLKGRTDPIDAYTIEF